MTGETGLPMEILEKIRVTMAERRGANELLTTIMHKIDGKSFFSRLELADAFDEYVFKNPIPGEPDRTRDRNVAND